MVETFYVTDLAGAEVAGSRNPGVDMEILLTSEQAEHPLRLGYVTRQKPRKVDDKKKSEIKKD